MSTSHGFGKGRVLAVDDDESMREAVARLLSAAGFAPAVYVSAEELLADDDWRTAAGIVADLRLPEMSGLQLLSEVRARGWGGRFVLITAHDAVGRREEALRHGAAAYLVKPFRGTALLAAITTEVPAEERS